jgi:uncharacterized protein YigE (DUF2233 family)
MINLARFHLFLLLLAFAILGSCQSFAMETQSADVAPCRPLAFANNNYIVCSIDLRRHDVRIFWGGGHRRPFGTISGFIRELDPAEMRRLIFAMNAGMYEQDLSPVGLLVERGSEVAPANTAQGAGNFYWKPNGIFFVGDGQVGILETNLYLQRRPRTEYATLSGPLLVVDGKIDSRILASTSSQNIRNGVGIRDAESAVFVISENPVTFADFAKVFRDALACRNALYFDGVVSDLFVPALNRMDRRSTVGPLVAVFARPQDKVK